MRGLHFAGGIMPMAIRKSWWRWTPMNLSAGSCFTSCMTALEKSGTMFFLRLGAKKLVWPCADDWPTPHSQLRNHLPWRCWRGYWGKSLICALAAKQATFPGSRPASPKPKYMSEILALWGGGSYTLFTLLLILFVSIQTWKPLHSQWFYRWENHIFPIASTPVSAASFKRTIRHCLNVFWRWGFSAPCNAG